MSEAYSKSEIEAALSDAGFSMKQLPGGFTYYYQLDYPGSDCILDWSRDNHEWQDIEAHLVRQGIDSNPIHDYLISHR